MTTKLANLMLVGVGGQGSVLAGQIIAQTAHLAGQAVRASEVHGMAQRGGSVCSTVRYGSQVSSPAVPEGEVDILIGFEKLETLRYLPQLKAEGAVLANDQQITPSMESLKLAPYPKDVEETLLLHTYNVWMVPGLEVANQLGNPKLANAMLLGVLSQLLDFSNAYWQQALAEGVPPKTLDLNQRAFAEGVSWAKHHNVALKKTQKT